MCARIILISNFYCTSDLYLVLFPSPRALNKIQKSNGVERATSPTIVPFGVTYEKIGTIQRRLAWPLHKDDTLSRSGRSTDLNIYLFCPFHLSFYIPILPAKFIRIFGKKKKKLTSISNSLCAAFILLLDIYKTPRDDVDESIASG